MKYKIMHDYGSYEGFKFADGEFDDIELLNLFYHCFGRMGAS